MSFAVSYTHLEQVEDVDMTLSFSVYEGDATTKETYEKEGKYTGQLVDCLLYTSRCV